MQTAEFQDWFGLDDEDSFHPADLLDDIEYARKILAEKIKSALDSDDTNSMMDGQLTFNF